MFRMSGQTRRWSELGDASLSVTFVRGYVHHSLSCDPSLVVFVALNANTGTYILRHVTASQGR